MVKEGSSYLGEEWLWSSNHSRPYYIDHNLNGQWAGFLNKGHNLLFVLLTNEIISYVLCIVSLI